MRSLNAEVVERSAAPGPLYNQLADGKGDLIAGDYDEMPRLPVGPEPAWRDFPVKNADPSDEDGPPAKARAFYGRLLNGPILLVARDQKESMAAARRMANALSVAGMISVAFSILIGFLAAWHASRRVEALTETAETVMTGDLKRRAPVSKWGDEFDQLAEAMNAMLDRLDGLMGAMRNAGDAIAHDLRTPLARMRRKIEQALDKDPGGEADRDALREALEETDRLLKTFNAVLQLSHLRSADHRRFEDVDIGALVTEMADFYEPAAEEAGVTFVSESGANLVARGDPRLIEQALANLLDNAMKYTPAGGRVELHAGRYADGRVEARVRDSGPGIPKADRDRVRDRFVRLERHRSTPGVGLGLALVEAVMELHGGEFRLEDGLREQGRPGLSAALVFVLPRE
jgi:signal transduction histidine kinase